MVLGVPEGSRAVVRQHIHTNLSRFSHIIPDDECFIGPIVEVQAKDLSTSGNGPQPMYTIQIPHCVKTSQHRENIRVRYDEQGISKLLDIVTF